MQRYGVAALGLIGLLGYFVALGAYGWHPGLRSFADDSMSYLVMAQALSPWQTAPEPIYAAWPDEVYPPVFPLLLAISGTGFDPAWARLLTAGISTVALGVMFAWLFSAFRSGMLAMVGVSLLALAFQWWILHLRILSEGLFLLWLLLLLHCWEREPPRRPGQFVLLLSLAVLLVLTRSIGLIIVPALLASAWLGRSRRQGLMREAILIGVGVLAAWSVWSLVRPDGTAGRYAGSLVDIIQALGSSDPLSVVRPQLDALIDAWFGVWLPYWRVGPNLPFMVMSLAAGAAIAGLLVRLREGRLDAWFALAYVSVLLLWPFPGQMTRFILPLVPLLILFAGDSLLRMAERVSFEKRQILVALPLAIWTSVGAPGLAFAVERSLDRNHPIELSRIAEFHLTADYGKAEAIALSQLAMFSDFARMREELPEDAVIMTFTPGYVALLAARHGVRFPESAAPARWLRDILNSGADFIYISRYHPRRTSENGLDGLVWLEGWTNELWRSRAPTTGTLQSLLLEISRPELQAILEAAPPS